MVDRKVSEMSTVTFKLYHGRGWVDEGLMSPPDTRGSLGFLRRFVAFSEVIKGFLSSFEDSSRQTRLFRRRGY